MNVYVHTCVTCIIIIIIYVHKVSCAAPFVGDGKVCGKDSDGDGYPDMQLNCNDSHCMQVTLHDRVVLVLCAVKYHTKGFSRRKIIMNSTF